MNLTLPQLGLPGTASPTLGLLLIILGLIMAFFGRKIIKIMTFILGGLIGAALAYNYFLPRFGLPITYIITIAAFLVIGGLALILLYLSAGLAAGAATYVITSKLFSGFWIPLLSAIIIFAVVLILFSKLLSIGTALLGGIAVSLGLGYIIPLPPIVSIILIAVVTIVGAYYQFKS